VAKRSYGQFCGLARALEIVGERWALLIVRDLLTGPKRFTDLHAGLPGIPTNILTARLRELEDDGVIARRTLARPNGSMVYGLTERGRELEDTVVVLGRWGAKSLDRPRPGEVMTIDAMTIALRATFRSEAARGLRVSYELRFGPMVLGARVERGKLEVTPGPLPGADAVIAARGPLHHLMSGTISPRQAQKSGLVHVTGDKRLFTRFAEMFRI